VDGAEVNAARSFVPSPLVFRRHAFHLAQRGKYFQPEGGDQHRDDAAAPSSFDELMNTRLTAETRPRNSSGAYSCTEVWRITAPKLSAAPLMTSAASAIQKQKAGSYRE